MGSRRLAIAAVVALGALGFAGSAQACTCVDLSPRAALRQADAAIVGRPLQVVPVDRFRSDYLYLVRRVYKKGAGIRAGSTLSIRSGPNGASCGLPPSGRRWYGLFLSRRGDRWWGGLCGLALPRELAAAASVPRRGEALGAGGSSSSMCNS